MQTDRWERSRRRAKDEKPHAGRHSGVDNVIFGTERTDLDAAGMNGHFQLARPTRFRPLRTRKACSWDGVRKSRPTFRSRARSEQFRARPSPFVLARLPVKRMA